MAVLSIFAVALMLEVFPAEAAEPNWRTRINPRSAPGASQKAPGQKVKRGKKRAERVPNTTPTAAVASARSRKIENTLDSLLALAVDRSNERAPRSSSEEAVRSLNSLEAIVRNATTPTVAEAIPALCRPTPIGLCLYGRFIVAGVWENPYLEPGVLYPMGAIQLTGQSGYMWFLSPGNMEVPIKMVDFCAIGRGVGVFAAGLSDFGVSLGVRDMVTGVQVNYINPPRSTFNTIIDQNTPWPCIF
ncbi:MAG: hypothetical protein K8I65_03470 [Thermoanaerobaculia bacterium]|nr:hypothetical protein [Thermoanaerobaculia bacterium]